MSYAQAMEGLHALGAELASSSGDDAATQPRRKFSLEAMRTLTDALGNPERQFRSVLIAGTNGKGSTAAMLASIAQTAGYRTGLYTSPHLVRANERIRIDGVNISDDDFARIYFKVDAVASELCRKGQLPQHPSFFEMMTAIAYVYFAEQQVELAVLEVGMGGRLDATNIVEPMVSIITDISLDHTEWLGKTIAEIAREKAGILRPNGLLVTLPQHPEANQSIGEVAMRLHVTGVNAAQFMPPAYAGSEETAWGVSYPLVLEGQTVEICPPLAGSHQTRNTALAIAAAVELHSRFGYKIGPDAIAEGVSRARWPGRLEMFPRTKDRCAVLLDVAHNPGGIWTLRAALGSVPATGGRTLLFGCLRDKAFHEMAQILFPLFDRVILTPVDSPRSTTSEELLDVAQTLGVEASAATSPERGFEEAIRQTPNDDLLVIAGSIFLIGALRGRLTDPDGRATDSRGAPNDERDREVTG